MKSALRTLLCWGLFTRWAASAVAARANPGPVLAAVGPVPGNSLPRGPLLPGPRRPAR